ncbi:MAG: flagellar biosynthesis protein FlhB [Planctomycetes bacterium]|nr:flagellar biosynthesis protein FlhB [Planctomycetota bacterium]
MPKEGPLGERTESATPKRRNETRSEGNVCTSRDLSQSVVLVVMFIFFDVYNSLVFQDFKFGMEEAFLKLPYLHFTQENVVTYGQELGSQLFLFMLPIWLVILFVSVTVIIAQVGLMFTLKPLTKFDLNKFNPITGVQKLMFSLKSIMKLVFSFLKLIAITFLLWYTLKKVVPLLLSLMFMGSVAAIGSVMWSVAFDLGMKVSILLLILALLDYTYQRWQYEEDIKMSKKEIEEEMKQMEGDPKIKGKRREIQRKIAIQRMMQSVPQADVVITNPTELAIAITYEPSDPAPRVVAKGAGYMAKRIRDVARENGVPVIERKPLAQALFKHVEIGEYVPEKFWQALAEVLAYVYELDEKKRQKFDKAAS